MRRAVLRGLLVAAVTCSPAACGNFAQTATPDPATTSAVASTAPPPASPSGTVSHGPAGNPTIRPGTALPGEDLSPDEVAALQQSIDEGHQPWRVHPDMVAEAYVRGRFGWEDLQVTMTDSRTAEATNRPDGQRVTLSLEQPGEQGPHGIWVVTGGTYLG